MKLLAFETATPSGGVALLVDGRVVGEVRLQGSQSHSKYALQQAGFLLETAKLQWKDLTHLATSHGPGSFTGVRVGLTIVKSLAWSLKLPCLSVNTLDVMAYHAYAGEAVEHVLPLIDARMGEVYTALYRVENGHTVRDSKDLVLSPAAAADLSPGNTLLCGEGERSYAPQFSHSRFHRAKADRLLPTAGAVAALALRSLELGEIIGPQDLQPIYLRDPVQRPAV
jgi:tRNA threonylcarbamoyladenosine biosynthesis protein TsaB